MIKPGRLLLLIFLLSLVWMSCERERDPCLEPRTVSARILFKNATETDTGAAITDTAFRNAIVGVVDSPVYFQLKNQSGFSFTLSPIADSTSFFIRSDSAKNGAFDIDTVTVFYQRRLAFISTACGYTYHSLLTGIRTTRNNIDSAIISGNDVNGNANTDHVKIYY